MNRIDELIKEKCPDGVEYKPLGELGIFYGGLTGKSKDDFKNGNAVFISYMNVFSNPALDITPSDRVRISEGERQHVLQYGDIVFTGSSETPDECGLSSVVTRAPNEQLYLNSFCFFFRLNDSEFFYPDFAKHLFRSSMMRKQIIKTASGVTRFNVSKKLMEKVIVPVVPMTIQKEIAGILDNMSELEAELEAELVKRKQQYEYYRESLLSFDNQEVEWLTLGDIFEIRNGYTPSKRNPEYWDNGNIPWFRMEDIRRNGNILKDSIQHITSLGVKSSGLFKRNSIMVATTATIGEHALIQTDYLSNQQLTNLTIKEEFSNLVMPKFAFYYFFVIDEQCSSVANYSGGIPIVDQNRFKKLLFPVLPIEKQRRIVEILDSFDSLTADLSRGLPAEIEARYKQYEYYRDKLLTFEEIKR